MTDGQRARRQRQRDKKRCRVFDENRSVTVNGFFDQTFASVLKNTKKKGCGLNASKIRG